MRISRFLRRLPWIAASLFAFSGSTLSAQDPTPRLAEIDATVAPLIADGHFPGVAVAVLDQGEPLHVGTHGFASLAHRAPVTPDTVFELASLTKHMTALAVLDLVAQGRLELDAPLVDFIEDAPETWSGITVDHLLGHMGGLEHRFEEKHRGEFLLEYSTQQMLASARQTPVASTAGTDWKYSDQGYFLLGLIMEKVTGTSYAQHMKSRFFDGFGMADTRMLDQTAIVPGLAQGYIFEEDELRRGRRVWQFGLTSHFGVLSTLNDMMRWEAALFRKRAHLAAVDRQSRQIQRNFSAGKTCREWGYARGWWAVDTGDRLLVYHAGYSGTAYIRDVTNGLAAIVLTNREVSEGQIEPLALAWAALNAAEPEIPAQGYRCWE